jgi:hypothetical protein
MPPQPKMSIVLPWKSLTVAERRGAWQRQALAGISAPFDEISLLSCAWSGPSVGVRV